MNDGWMSEWRVLKITDNLENKASRIELIARTSEADVDRVRVKMSDDFSKASMW